MKQRKLKDTKTIWHAVATLAVIALVSQMVISQKTSSNTNANHDANHAMVAATLEVMSKRTKMDFNHTETADGEAVLTFPYRNTDTDRSVDAFWPRLNPYAYVVISDESFKYVSEHYAPLEAPDLTPKITTRLPHKGKYYITVAINSVIGGTEQFHFSFDSNRSTSSTGIDLITKNSDYQTESNSYSLALDPAYKVNNTNVRVGPYLQFKTKPLGNASNIATYYAKRPFLMLIDEKTHRGTALTYFSDTDDQGSDKILFTPFVQMERLATGVYKMLINPEGEKQPVLYSFRVE